MSAPKILLLTLEYPKWKDAGKFSYESNFGLEEGLAAGGARCFTAPIMFAGEGSPWLRWADAIRARLNGTRFDQVWFDIVHAGYPEGFLDWMAELAPVRVGFFGESSAFDPLELANNPLVSRQRQAKVDRALPYATHVVAVDEVDVDRFNAAGKTPAFWWAAGRIPQAYIAKEPAPIQTGQALFHGTLYGRRREWIEHPALQGKLALGTSLEAQSQWPAAYDELTDTIEQALAGGANMEGATWDRVVEGIRRTRRACYPLWMQSLRMGSAVVNLPQFARAYASRVTQGLAAGVPVVTWEIPERPKTRALFADGEEILLYRGDSPESLAARIDSLRSDPGLGRRLAARGLEVMRARHTTEGYVRDLLGWIQESARTEPGVRREKTGAGGGDVAGVRHTTSGGTLDQLKAAGVWHPGRPLRLHLGCGEQRFEGYINIDYPSAEHNVMRVRPDFETDIRAMRFPESSVDEIRLHHVFEHFNRVTALAMLIRWHGWLKPGGRLVIETPDIEGCAQVLLSPVSWKARMGVIRHLAGDQAASWAYHVDHWFPERYQRTLQALGFGSIQTQTTRWAKEPYLSNVLVQAQKMESRTEEHLLASADSLLMDSLVAEEEKPTWEVWRQQLRDCLRGADLPMLGNVADVHAVATAKNETEVPVPVADGPVTELYLGIKMLGHDAAVFALFPGQQDVFGMAEERMTRYKHDDLFPLDALQRMLDYKRIDPAAVVKVHVGGAFLCQRDQRLPVLHYELTRAWRAFFGARYTKDFKAASAEFFALPQPEQIRRLQASPEGGELIRLLSSDTETTRTLDVHYRHHLQRFFPNARIEIDYFDHEYCHAVSAYYSSGFDEALVIAFDGWGDAGTFSRIYSVKGGRFTELSKCVSPNRQLRLRDGSSPIVHECSIGGIYSCFTQLLGFTPDSDEGKTEALAAYGKWDNALYRELGGLVTVSVAGGIQIDHARAQAALRWERLEQLLKTLSREDIAAAVQKFAEDAVLAYVKPWVEQTGIRRLCLSGGVMANVILNLKIYQQLADEVFITPAMADDGAAQGAAILELLGNGATAESLQWYRRQELPYWGTSYTVEEVRERVGRFLKSRQGELEFHDLQGNWPVEAAERICRGQVGAIFHGRMEWGPRALGNRSIIADARNPRIRDIINRDIKNRPPFQPFCPSMLAEERERLFERSYLNKHMTIAFDLRKEFWDLLPGAIHIDGTSRVQFVTRQDNPNYHRLLSRVKEITGYGVIINTSFNKHGRTIVESPEDALQDFVDSKLDFVIIEGVMVCKKAVAPQKTETPSDTVGVVVFSKDRPLQLEATLRSLSWQSRDSGELQVRVLYTTTSAEVEAQYQSMMREFPGAVFVRERQFQQDLVRTLREFSKVLFVVDDCLFVRDFSLREVSAQLDRDAGLLGCSLRLGRNTTYCYPLDRDQRVPELRSVSGRMFSFQWVGAEHDFGYPLEVSSSVFRVADLLPVIEAGPVPNPNILEARLSEAAGQFATSRPRLLCFESSRAFCAPWNKVQSTYANRAGSGQGSDATEFQREFAKGRRLDLDRYTGYTPRGCHEEVSIHLTEAATRIPSVSVVVPCYNQAEYIRECLESVQAQTFKDWEVVVVNDGSTDDSVAVVQSFMGKNPGLPIRLIHRENGGLSEARNTGIRVARSEWILPLDADDKIAPLMLQKVMAAARENPEAGVVFTDVQQFGSRNDVWITGQGEPASVLINTRHAYCSLIRRSVWSRVGGYKANMVWGYEDWDFWVGCHECGVREVKVPEALFFYRTKKESMLTRALSHDAELRAQIVLNHPRLFDDSRRAAATATLKQAAAADAALVSSPGSVETLLQAASVKLGQQDAAGACDLIQQAVLLSPKRPDLLETLGALQFQQGDYEPSFAAFNQAVALTSEAGSDLLLKCAMAAVRCNQVEAFEALVERILAKDPNHSGTLRFLASLNMEAGRWTDAGRWYQRLLVLNARDLDALLGIGRVFAEAGELDAARATYEQVLTCEPGNAVATDNLNVIRQRMKAAAEAAANRLPPQRVVDPDLQAAEKAYAENRLHDAEEHLALAASRRPDDAEAWSALGSLRFQLGRYLDAQLAFTRVTLIQPANPEAWIALAHSAVKGCDIQLFESAMGKALELEPESDNAQRLLLRLNMEQERFVDAARIARDLLSRSPDDTDLLIALGVCFAKCAELHAAASCFEKVLERDSSHRIAAENLAAVRASIQAEEEAASRTPIASFPSVGPAGKEAALATPFLRGPEIAVILPTFNRGEILVRCLEGFARQSLDMSRFEVVVLDDGSSPSVEPLMRQFEGRLHIRYQWQTNAGLAAARNAAIAAATAPLLALHDDDDVPAPDYLERCLRFHAEHPDEADILLARLVPDSCLEKTPLLEWVFDAANGVIGFPEPGTVNGYSRFYGGTSSCKRSLFRHSNYNPDYRFGFEDMEFAFRLSRRTPLRVHYHPEVYSTLIRGVTFDGLFLRLYREGRSLRRFYEASGSESFEIIPPAMNHSSEVLALFEPRIPEILALIRRMELPGGLNGVQISLDGKQLRGADALKAVYSLAAKYSRAAGWLDLARGVEEQDGMMRMKSLLEARPDMAPVQPRHPARPRALVYFHSNPHPSRSGAHRRCLSVLRALRDLGYEVVLASSGMFTDQPWSDDGMLGLERELNVRTRIYPATDLDAVEIRTARAAGDLGAMHATTGLRAWFHSVFQEEQPAVVLINYAYHAALVDHPDFRQARLLVEMHDLVTLGGAMIEALASNLGPAPYTAEGLKPGTLKDDFFASRSLAPQESEFSAYARFHSILAISRSEGELVQQKLPGASVTWLPVTAEVPPMENTHSSAPVFVGFGNGFNVQGLLYFVECVLPEIRSQIPNFTLRVAGDVCSRIKPRQGLELLGYVEDLQALYAGAAFAICPLLGGTGQQVKVAEAMAHGLAVVVHSNVAGSSPVEDGVNGFVASDPKMFAKRMVELCHDLGLRQRLGEAARVTILRDFNREMFRKRLAAAIRPPAPSVNETPAEPPAKVTLPVRWFAPFFNTSGYAAEAIQFALSLEGSVDLGITHQNRIFSEAFVASLSERERDGLKKLEEHGRKQVGGIVICHTPAPGFHRVDDGLYHIGRTMFETDRLPADWVSCCNRMDEIWVPSHFQVETFTRAGVAPEKLHVVPGLIDLGAFNPECVKPLELPNRASFNFLSVFEWSSRKGWDVLLSAYLQEFSAADDVCLYLKCFLADLPDEDSTATLRARIEEFVASLKLGDKKLPRIEILGRQIPRADLPRLYKAVDCLVAPSRGEGWGRPQHEAMAMGVPVIATGWSGVTEFLDATTAFPIEYDLVEARGLEPELWHYHGHRWAEPRQEHLRQLLRTVQSDPARARAHAAVGMKSVRERFSPESVRKLIVRRLAEIETRITVPSCPVAPGLKTAVVSSPDAKPVKIAWEGPFLDFGSLAHVNRELTQMLSKQPQINLIRVGKNVLPPELARISSLQQTARTLRAQSPGQCDVVVRHAWPPSWDPPGNPAWVWFQPWEYGVLPADWVHQSRKVREIWTYSTYARNVFVDSGVDPARVRIVPLGIDPAVFKPGITPLPLSAKARFKFLFVGGTIHRKGPDLLLQAFLEAFTAADDVCLVIKDFGGKGVYAGQTLHETIEAARRRPNAPEILHLDEDLDPEQMPSLYAACDALVHPYRGEGFGLPVLEAMACGLPVIVTAGGSTDDFATDEFAYRIPSTRRQIDARVGEWPLAHRGWLLEPDVKSLGRILRHVYEDPGPAQARGMAAADHVRANWTWERSAAVAASHLRELVAKVETEKRVLQEKRNRKAAAIQLPPVALLGQLTTAREMLDQGRLMESWSECLAALNVRPFHPEAIRLMADVAAAAGDLPLAAEMMKRVQRMVPDWSVGRRTPGAGRRNAARPGVQLIPPAAADPDRPRLSVCVITRNEEKFIGRCLASIRGVADQIVCVDTGSTDRTVEIARTQGAEIHAFEWCDDFSAARNFALSRATGDWVLAIDADEELDQASAEALLASLKETRAMAWRLPIVDVGQEKNGRSFVPRLFRNAPGLFYVGRIHEQVFSSVEVRRQQWGLDNRLGSALLLHHGYSAAVTRDRRKIARNLRLLERAVEEFPNEPSLLMNFGLELNRAGQREAAIQQYTEAWHALGALPPRDVVPELRETLLVQMASILMASGDFAGVIQVVDSPVGRQAPFCASLHFSMGLAHLQLRQYPEAIEHMKACLRKREQPALSPVHADILTVAPRHCLAVALGNAGQQAAAAAAFHEALMEDPHSRPLLWDYARFESESGRPVEALKVLHKLISQDPADLAAWQCGSQIALSRAEFAEFALDWTAEAIRNFPGHPAILRARAEALTGGGMLSEAGSAWAAVQGRPNAAHAAAKVLCDLSNGRFDTRFDPASEVAVSQECLKWYRRMVEANATRAVQQINSHLTQLRDVLPSASGVLTRAVTEADACP